VLDSLMTGNQAIGRGANPARAGTPGGGSGGAIYNDGDDYQLTVEGTIISGNRAREGGGAIFFVSNDRTGSLLIKKSALHGNPNDGFFTAGYPGIFFLGRGTPVVTGSTVS
jgi:predicted outer membrane repeat protein